MAVKYSLNKPKGSNVLKGVLYSLCVGAGAVITWWLIEVVLLWPR